MSDLRELYQEVILDHSRKPRNYRELPEGGCRHAEGHNPLCGDKVSVFVDVKDDVIVDVTFKGSGCAISTASASLMTDFLRGKSVAEVEAVFKEFHELVTSDNDENAERLGKLRVLAGVREYPVRVKCATLAWHTLKAALEDQKAADPITTE